MIILLIVLVLIAPDLIHSAEAGRRRAEAERRQAERAAELQRRQAEKLREVERRRAEADRKRERAEAAARTVIEFWEPRRRDLIRRIDAERDADRRRRLEVELYSAEQRLQKAYWTLERDL